MYNFYSQFFGISFIVSEYPENVAMKENKVEDMTSRKRKKDSSTIGTVVFGRVEYELPGASAKRLAEYSHDKFLIRILTRQISASKICSNWTIANAFKIHLPRQQALHPSSNSISTAACGMPESASAL
jgi:hypothetical protein